MYAKKVLFGLRQSPRAWFGRFAKFMESGYKQNKEITLFINHSTARRVIVLLFYVVNIIVIGNDDKEKYELK